MSGNLIEKAIAFVSPGRALQRARDRYLLGILSEHAKRKYEGASRGRRTEGWQTVGTGAASEVLGGAALLRARHRDLVRNNPYAAAAVRGIASNMIGKGITPHFDTKRKAQKREVEALAVAHLDTTAIDADGNHDLYGLESLWARTVAESGSVLIRRRKRRVADGLPVPFQVQTLEPDYLDPSRDRALPNGGLIINGIEFDARGKRVQYWLFPDHPGDAVTWRRLVSKPVPADEIAHIYRVDRPGQVDGVPWGASIIIRLRDFDEYQDARLLLQKAASAQGAFVQDSEIGVGQRTPSGPASSDPLIDKIEPMSIEFLPPGKSITFNTPPSTAGETEYAKVTLHGIAAGYGVPYFVLTGDLTDFNFSSGRMGWLEFQRNIDLWRYNMMLPMGCAKVARWFLEAAALSGTPTDGVSVKWGMPRREMIDPSNEEPAIRDKIRSGRLTPSQSLRDEGVDPDKHWQEYAADLARLDKDGIVLDIDARKVSRNGVAQSTKADATKADANAGDANADAAQK